MTTVSDELEEAVQEEGSSPEPPPVDSTRRGARRARSLTLPSLPAKDAVTERVRKVGTGLSAAAALLDKPGSLIHAQPPTFKQARDRHHECANHYQVWRFMRLLRLAWGYFHLVVIMPVLYLAWWITESPARLVIAAAVCAGIRYFG